MKLMEILFVIYGFCIIYRRRGDRKNVLTPWARLEKSLFI